MSSSDSDDEEPMVVAVLMRGAEVVKRVPCALEGGRVRLRALEAAVGVRGLQLVKKGAATPLDVDARGFLTKTVRPGGKLKVTAGGADESESESEGEGEELEGRLDAMAEMRAQIAAQLAAMDDDGDDASADADEEEEEEEGGAGVDMAAIEAAFGKNKAALTLQRNQQGEMRVNRDLCRLLEWIESVLHVNTGALEPSQALCSGELLCRVANHLVPGSVSSVHADATGFKAMDNANNFLRACKAAGVPSGSLFSPNDLVQGENLAQVVACVSLFRDKAGAAPDVEEVGERLDDIKASVASLLASLGDDDADADEGGDGGDGGDGGGGVAAMTSQSLEDLMAAAQAALADAEDLEHMAMARASTDLDADIEAKRAEYRRLHPKKRNALGLMVRDEEAEAALKAEARASGGGDDGGDHDGPSLLPWERDETEALRTMIEQLRGEARRRASVVDEDTGAGADVTEENAEERLTSLEEMMAQARAAIADEDDAVERVEEERRRSVAEAKGDSSDSDEDYDFDQVQGMDDIMARLAAFDDEVEGELEFSSNADLDVLGAKISMLNADLESFDTS